MTGLESVLAAEAETIRVDLPLYNVEHNTDNPLRMPPLPAMKR
ncbi:hypothetical protein Areg01_81790 [Actinoplanes regularis]|nr:hypothetical protein Areg01_81790 [Actinoplanes regularis]